MQLAALMWAIARREPAAHLADKQRQDEDSKGPSLPPVRKSEEREMGGGGRQETGCGTRKKRGAGCKRRKASIPLGTALKSHMSFALQGVIMIS